MDRLVVPGLAGNLWMCGKHAVGPDVEALLSRTGAGHVVCLVQPDELMGRYPEYAEWLRVHQPERATWSPTHDLAAPSDTAAAMLADRLFGLLSAGVDVVVHCAAGFGRTGTIVACLLVRIGVPSEEAVAMIRQARPMAGPETGSQRALVDRFATAAVTEPRAAVEFREPDRQ